MAKQKRDLHQEITDKIVAAMESNPGDWTRSWSTGGALTWPTRQNGARYQGVNIILLWMAAQENGWAHQQYMTFKQAKTLGGTVKKGSKGTQIIFYKMLPIEDRDTGEKKEIPMLRGYYVFNVAQIDGLPEQYYQKPAEALQTDGRLCDADHFFEVQGGTVNHGGNRACLNLTTEAIAMPHFDQFRDAGSYYATLAHEYIHWTGCKSRLDRINPSAFGSLNYAKEELVAELGAAFVMAHLGLSSEPRPDHAQYLASWVATMKADKKAVFKAMSAASKAAEYLIDRATVVEAEPLPLAA